MLAQNTTLPVGRYKCEMPVLKQSLTTQQNVTMEQMTLSNMRDDKPRDL